MNLTFPRTTGLLIAAVVALTACPKAEEAKKPEPKGEAAAASPAGDRDALVALPAESQKLIDLKVEPVAIRTLATTFVTTGTIASNADREAHVTTRVAGRVTHIMVGVGAPVHAGQTLATLESVALGQTQSEFLQTQAKADLARTMYERQRQLFADNLTAKKEVQAAANDLRLVEIEVERLTNQLKLLGFGPERVRQLARTRQLDPTVPLLSPIDGVVVTKHLTVGEMLEPNTQDPAFTITDVSQLWVNADVPEKDLASVRSGQPAKITTTAYPDRQYHGRVSLVSAGLDKETRTAKARVVVDNHDRRLKPEMFANITIAVGERSVLVVPKAAVQEEDKQKLVYVPAGEGKFRESRIQVGMEYPEYFQVVAGLKAGDKIVTKGAFDLRAQARKSTFGGEE